MVIALVMRAARKYSGDGMEAVPPQQAGDDGGGRHE